jgi:AcrR family transcriptional regulator
VSDVISGSGQSVAAKGRILAAASELFLEGGVRALSVRAMANRAGVSTIGIYSHFNGKQGILDALYIEGFERVSEAIDVSALGLPPREAVMLAAQRYLEMADRNVAHYRLIFGESGQAHEPSDEAKAVGAQAFATMARQVAKLLPADADRQRKQDAALDVWALLHGYVSLKQHHVSRIVDMDQWKAKALRALAVLVDELAGQ